MIFKWRLFEGVVGGQGLSLLAEGPDNPQTVFIVNQHASQAVGTIVVRVGCISILQRAALGRHPEVTKIEALSATSYEIWLRPDVTTCAQARQIIDSCR